MPVSLHALLRTVGIRVMVTREWWQSGVTYNPLSPQTYRNPYPRYALLRAKDPVHWSPLMGAWILSRYEDVDAVLRDHKRFSSDARNRRGMRRRLRQSMVASPNEPPSMLFSDPPDHTRLRALVNKAFSPQAIEALRPRIQAIAAELLDQIQDPTAFDVLETIAYPLPVIVMAELLGVPTRDRAQFKLWSDQRSRLLEPTVTASEVQVGIQAAREFNAYFLDIINARRKAPRDDLISALVAAEEAGDKLTQVELLVMLRLLLIAGNETATNLIGNGLLALLRHPDQLQALRDDPGLMPSAVEELVRYDGPVQTDGRTAMEDIEIKGRHIQKGQSVVMLIGSANHDPEVFHHPEQLDITRKEASHIAFGRGIHHCLGALLARLESRIAFEAILARFADIRLLTDHPQFKDNIVLRSLRSLPVSASLARG